MSEEGEARRKRAQHFCDLYRSGYTLAQIGAMEPQPISHARVHEILREGVRAGWFPKPLRGTPSDAIDRETVYRARLASASRVDAARTLDVSVHTLRAQYLDVLIAAERKLHERRLAERRARQKAADLAQYLEIAAAYGYRPGSTLLPPTLRQRIYCHFGGFHRFWAETGLQPERQRRSKKGR